MANPLSMSDLVGEDAELDEFAPIPRAERIAKSLATTEPRKGGMLTPTQVNNITKARLRALCTDVVHEELPRVREALKALADDSPKVYLETLMAFMEFSMPKLKAMEIDVSDNRESAKEMTLDELQRAFSDTSVVSTQ